MKQHHPHELIIKVSKFLSLIGGIVVLYYIWLQSAQNVIPSLPKRDEANEPKKGEPKYDVTLSNPLFKGFNKDLEPYIIKAYRAVKTSEQKYKFDRVESDYSLGKVLYHIKSDAGVLDDNSKWFYLNDGVKVAFNDFNLTSDEISINLHSKESYSNSYSIITFKDSRIVADSYHATDENNIVKFKGHVKTRIHLQDF